VSEFKMGDIVVLTAGSMRMAVEMIEKDKVSTVWCNEGIIGRDTFASALLKKWEYREEDKTRSSRGFDKRDARDSSRTEKPKGKTGWDGKPREKKFFRKD
jgi:hypothetical protein